MDSHDAQTAGSVPLVVARELDPLVAFSKRAGIPLPRLPDRLRAGAATLPLVYGGRLWEEAARASGDEGIGLRVGEASRFEDVPPGRHVNGSPTIGKGLAAAAGAVERYCAGERLWLTLVGGDVWVQRRHTEVLRRGRRQVNDFALRIVIDIVRRGAGPQWRPTELRLEGPPPRHAKELAALATKSVRFGAPAETLVFPRSVLALPLLPAAGSSFTPGPSLPTVDFVDSIRHAIRALLAVGELELPSVAEAAGMSVRSLQRRLAASNLSFARLVDEARFEAASTLLRDPDVRIVDVSAELGYTDAANFTRAFRRWAGVSPLAFRQARLDPAADTI
jgi:AraC-like DNA-binding protein